MKCRGGHEAKACPKTFEQSPHCVNRMLTKMRKHRHYRGCKFYLHVRDIAIQKQNVQKPPTLPNTTNGPLLQSSKTNINAKMFYVNATNQNLISASNKIKIANVLSLLINLLTTLNPEKDYKSFMIQTINSFISIHASFQCLTTH